MDIQKITGGGRKKTVSRHMLDFIDWTVDNTWITVSARLCGLIFWGYWAYMLFSAILKINNGDFCVPH